MNNFLTNFNDFEDNFDNFLDEGWFGKPMHLQFNCKNKDMMPSFWETTDNGYKCTCRTVGISPKNVKVEMNNNSNSIHIEGKTKLDGYEYSTKYDLPLTEDIINNIENIKYKTENGITIIYVQVNRPEKKKINIEQM